MSTVKDEAIKLRKNIDEVYETGKQAEYDAFWDNFQNYGNPQNYNYAFAYYRWNDENYNPKYPINCTTDNTGGRNIFRASKITDTKVTISIPNDGSALFYSAPNIKTIRKLIVTENTNLNNAFYSVYTIENIEIEGVIGRTFSIAGNPLTVESMKSIITHLKDYSGTDTAGTYELNFSSACWTALEADSTAPDGGTWLDYVNKLGWLT